MKRMMLGLLGATAFIAAATSAQAAGGCGPGFHRGPYGGCRANYGPGPALAGPAFGVFYPGRGYWDGHRYWANRYRYGGGWRYR